MTGYGVQSITYTPPSSLGGSVQPTVDPQSQEIDFLKLLITEVSNQTPDSPMDSTAMITQYSQMEAAIGLSKLTASSRVYQNAATASGLMNQQVKVTAPATVPGEKESIVSGKVEAIDFSQDMPTVQIAGRSYPLASVIHIGI